MPGVIDFQDAVYGPVTYDLVSLLRDAYVMWDEEVQIDLAVRYWERARAAKLPVPADFAELWRHFEWMGVQRHIKVLGIFARLYHRDGKSGYLSQSSLPLYFGLGDDTAVTRVEVRWPSGKAQVVTQDITANNVLRIREPQ